ncbi:unnamed protein product, partial [Linum tenue]
ADFPKLAILQPNSNRAIFRFGLSEPKYNSVRFGFSTKPEFMEDFPLSPSLPTDLSLSLSLSLSSLHLPTLTICSPYFPSINLSLSSLLYIPKIYSPDFLSINLSHLSPTKK